MVVYIQYSVPLEHVRVIAVPVAVLPLVLLYDPKLRLPLKMEQVAGIAAVTVSDPVDVPAYETPTKMMLKANTPIMTMTFFMMRPFLHLKG